MAELVRIAHDAHGLDPALDDIHREHAPDPDLSLLLGNGPSRSAAGGVSGALHARGELLRVDVIGLQERQRLLGREPLGLPKLPLGRASQQAAGLAVDPPPPALELADPGRFTLTQREGGIVRLEPRSKTSGSASKVTCELRPSAGSAPFRLLCALAPAQPEQRMNSISKGIRNS